MSATTTELRLSKTYEWILNPWIDILFCCGGLVWFFFIFHYFFVDLQKNIWFEHALFPVTILITHLLSNSHTAATLVRIYKDDKTCRKFSMYSFWVAIICIVIAIYSLLNPWMAPILAKIYFLWVVQHYTSQSYGISLIYCYKRGYFLNNFEKKVFWLLMYTTAYYAILKQLTYPEHAYRSLLNQPVPFWGPLPDFICNGCLIVLITIATLFTYIIIHKGITEKKLFPLPAFILTITGILIWITIGNTSRILWLYIPAFFHGSQYLVVNSAYHFKEKGLPDGVSTSNIALLLKQPKGLCYLGLLVVLGYFITFGIADIIKTFGVEYSVAFTVIFSVINFHHFITDWGIWRLREPGTRQILLA